MHIATYTHDALDWWQQMSRISMKLSLRLGVREIYTKTFAILAPGQPIETHMVAVFSDLCFTPSSSRLIVLIVGENRVLWVFSDLRWT